jgi:16S rRNA (uracil1498-N3)-methyltransferase
MECIYIPDLSKNSISIQIPESEIRHIRALRLKKGDDIMITNGEGISCYAKINYLNKNECFAEVNFFLEDNHAELIRKVALALGILQDRDRFEFALEKAVELGVSEFIPLITDYSQKNKINVERLRAKAIAALKQCKRSFLPIIYNPIKLDEIIKFNYDCIILADSDGSKPYLKSNNESIIYVVGPEGGFSSKELELLQIYKAIRWNLGNRRLRAETSAIVGLSLINLLS